MAKIYMICSVRERTEEAERTVLGYVETLEKEGHHVRCPFRDTNQEDETGLRIVEEHEGDIYWAEEIHVMWNPESQGSHWDFAQVRMAKLHSPNKRVVLANPHEVSLTPHKSYNNVVIATCLGLSGDISLETLAAELQKYINGL